MSVQVMIAVKPNDLRVAVFANPEDANRWRVELEKLGYKVTRHARQVQ